MDVQADLRSYYDEEARQQLRKDLTGRRVEVRNRFIELLQREGRTAVVDFGAGPGWDVAGFLAAGQRCVGVDIAPENAKLAAKRELDVLTASITAPPLRPASFDAGWSMSTLMHVPDAEMPCAVESMASVLTPGSPFMIGLWGGDHGEALDMLLPGERRLFCHRPADHNASFFERVGTIEHREVWPTGPDIHEYQLFRVRRR